MELRIAKFVLGILISIQLKAQITSCESTWYQGEGTHYGGIAGGAGGHCSIPIASGDIYHCAMNHIQYANSSPCGACVRVLGPKGEVILKVADECPECKFGDIDLTTGVFPQIAELKDGRVKIKWQYVPCPLANDITLVFEPGSGPYYFKAQVRDAFYPIAELAYKKQDGTYDTIARVVYNYFVKQGGIDEDKSKAGPYQLRFTSTTGETVEASNIAFNTTDVVHTGVQFKKLVCPDCAGEMDGTAKLDFCNVCSGGTTGIVPNSTCSTDCAGYWEGTAYVDGCGKCVAGTTGATPCGNDCYGVPGGMAYVDHCGTCVGGKTGNEPCAKDCHNDWGGTAVWDSCGKCAGGKTEVLPILDPQECAVLGLSQTKDKEPDVVLLNPFEDELLVAPENQLVKMQINDVSGNVLLETNLSRITTSKLPSGLYLLTIWLKDKVIVKKVAKR